MARRRIDRRHIGFAVFAFLVAATMSFVCLKHMNSSSAINAAYSGFKAGNIINDYVMGNYSSMTESDIQNFLKSKNSCNDTNTSKAKTYSSHKYHIENGHFVCMADEKFDGETAAHIIWQAAQDYKINPRVLIVLLEKEQGLVTDTWPNSDLQYRSATGYGCPDTAACDSQYYGFKNQVRNAAKFFRKNLDGDPNWTNYPIGKNTVLYNPNRSCGSSVVNIENRATGALYTYTPYQPNSAVLNAGPGVTVNCGAYGNANFYYYFTKWFGDTHGAELEGSYIPDGTYRLQTQAGLALSFAGTTNGSEARIITANESDKLQQFKVTRTGKYYRFQNVATGKYLDVYNNESNDGTKVELWDGNTSCAQKWLLRPFGAGFRIVSSCSSEASTKSLDVYGATISQPNTKTELWASNSSTAQQWFFVSLNSATIKNGTYGIKTVNNKALTSSKEAASAGNSATIWYNTTSASERFEITRTKDGLYNVKQVSSGLFLTVKDANLSSGAAITLDKKTDNCSQKWSIEKNGGYYKFVSSCSSLLLDVYGANTNTNGAKLQTYSSNSSNAQKWIIGGITSQPVKDGSYAFDSALGNNLRLDTATSANINAWYRNGGKNQIYTLKYDSNTGYYTLQNTAINKYLTAANNGANNANVSATQSVNGCSSKWMLLKVDSQYKIFNACSRNVIDISGGKANAGSNVIVWTENGGKNQLWTISTDFSSGQAIASGTYYIESGVGSSMRLDVDGSRTAKNGTNVQIWHPNTSNSQKFKITYNANDNSYTLYNLFANRPLDATGAIAKNNINAEVWSSNSSCAQKWKISSMGNNYYRIASACGSSFSLDVAGAKSKAGTNVLLWSNHNNNNQKWKFIKI